MEKDLAKAAITEIPVNEGELGIVDNTTITPILEEKALTFKKGPNKKIIMKLSLTFIMDENDRIIIGEKDRTVNATSVGIFDFKEPNWLTQGACSGLILTTGEAPGEVRFASLDDNIELITSAEKREHGHAAK